MTKVRFSGFSKGKYAGAVKPVCDPESRKAKSWMANTASECRSYHTREEVLGSIQSLLDWAYNEGCNDTQKRIEGNILKVMRGVEK